MGKSAGRPPPAPDPRVVANAQADANIQAAQATAALNRVNTTTPFGTLTYRNVGQTSLNDVVNQRYADYQAGTYRPTYYDDWGKPRTEFWAEREMEMARRGMGTDAGRWESETTLSPEAQALVNNLFQDAGTNGGRERVEGALFDRLSPLMERDRLALETRLRNQGLTPGGEAWQNAIGDLGRQENDARLAVIGQAGNEQSRAINALLSIAGAAPTAGGGGGGGAVQPVDWQSLYGNQQAGQMAQYNARAQNAASGNAAAAGIASAAIAAAAIA